MKRYRALNTLPQSSTTLPKWIAPRTLLPLVAALSVTVSAIAHPPEDSPPVALPGAAPEAHTGMPERSVSAGDTTFGMVRLTPPPASDGTENTDEPNSEGTVALPVEQGGTGVLELTFSAGQLPFAAALIAVTFDPDALEVVEVTPSDGSEEHLLLEHVLLPGKLRVVAVNTSSSLDEPVGTVKLVQITVRPLTEAGTVIAVNATQHTAFNTNLVAYRNRTSGSANLIVTAPAATSAADNQ